MASINLNDCFYFDPSSGFALSYRQLADEMAAIGSIPDVVRGDEACEYLVALMAAIAGQQNIALLPPGMSLDEARSEVERSPNIQQTAGDEERVTVLPRDAGAEPWNSAEAPTSAASTGRTSTRVISTESERSPISLSDVRESRCKVGIFTSGTTGRPKLVWHSLHSLTRGVRVSPKHEHDVWGLSYHPAHFAGLQVALQAILNGNPLVRLFGLSSSEIQNAIHACEITHISATPTLFKLLTTADQIYPGVQSITLGGERMPETLAASLHATFPQARIRNIYASTEVGSLLVGEGSEFEIPTSLADRIRIIDGELVVHRTLLADSLQAGSLPEFDDDEYFPTGDLVEITSDDPQRFTITSRRSDWINVGGYKVNPHKIESLITAEPTVAEARVFGKSNSVTGHIVCCEIVPRDAASFDLRTLKQQLRQQLERHEVPQIFQIVSELPTTSSGKKQRSVRG